MDEQVVYDPNAAGQGDQIPPGNEGEPPDGGVPPEEGAEEIEYEEVPAPTGLAALFGGSWKKKLLIALGIIIIIIILIILIFPKNQRGKDVTLAWWGLWEDNAIMQPLIDGFEKQHPTIKIKYTKQDPTDYRNTLIARIQNGTGPDIYRYHNTWVPLIYNVLAPLPKDVITPENFQSQYYPFMQNDLTYNGAIYGIPIGVDSIALFVNTDLLKKAGWTVPKNWNEFRDAAKAMTERDKNTKKILIAGAALGTYDNINHAPDIISVIFHQQGIKLNSISTEKERLIDTLGLFYTSFSKGDDAVWDSSLDNSQLAFARGQLAMYFGFSWDVFAIEKLKSNSNLKYEIHPVPAPSGGKIVTTVSYWAEGVSKNSKNQKEAMLFMNYLTQKETLQKFYTEASKARLFGEPYPRSDMAVDLKDNPLVYPFVSQLNDAKSSYFASATHDGDTGLNTRSNINLQNCVNTLATGATDTTMQVFLDGMKVVLQDNGIQ